MKAPFPYFGGKSVIASAVWERFGHVRNYVEPFFGSGAVLLSRASDANRIETVNDSDGLLANFWRALKADPECVAHHADWPVSECDLHARHIWLVGERERITDRLMGDPDWFDAKAAGWWVWGISCWIGGGWCSGEGPWRSEAGVIARGDAGRGINRRRPHLSTAGQGINRQLPHLGTAGQGIGQMMRELADRLRRVRVCSGDWTRVLGPSVTVKNGMTAVFLDPPYTAEAGRDMAIYAKDSGNIGRDALEWARANGDNPLLRIAICSYGEHDPIPGWERLCWHAAGGYGNRTNGRGRANKKREVIDFSPHCLKQGLFDQEDSIGCTG